MLAILGFLSVVSDAPDSLIHYVSITKYPDSIYLRLLHYLLTYGDYHQPTRLASFNKSSLLKINLYFSQSILSQTSQSNPQLVASSSLLIPITWLYAICNYIK